MAFMTGRGLLVASVLLLQVAAQEPAFEVASVRRNTSGESGGRFDRPPGRFRTTNIPLIVILQTAFGLRTHEIVGAPPWISRERFDIDAVEPSGTYNQDQRNAMIRTLLRNRFKLNARKESRDSAVYSLVLARADGRLGPDLRTSDADSSTSNNFDPVNGAMVDAKGMTIAQSIGRTRHVSGVSYSGDCVPGRRLARCDGRGAPVFRPVEAVRNMAAWTCGPKACS